MGVVAPGGRGESPALIKKNYVYASLIIPSYNSAKVLENNLPYLLNFFGKRNNSFEIIIVDDGSNDDGQTERIARELGCIYLRLPENSGKGAALKMGMLHAKGRFRLFTDADAPFEAEAFERFLFYLDQKEFDLVIGDRTLPGSKYHREIPALRKLASAWFSFLVGRFVVGGLFDTQCGLKGFRADVANDLFGISRMRGFTIDVEILYVALKRNYDIKRLPVVLRSQEGASVKILRHSLTMMIDLFRIKTNHVLKRYAKKNDN